MSGADTVLVVRAIAFAARAHVHQRRKGAAQDPYVNHLLEVAELVAEATDGEAPELVAAAVLHDVLEDTRVERAELIATFGERIAGWVAENSDDMSLPKEERKRRRLELALHKSPEARLIKVADLVSNLRAIADAPPAGWPPEWCLGYLQSCRDLHTVLAGTNARLDAAFERAAAEAAASLERRSARLAGGGAVDFRLDASAGQEVYLVYLANTEVQPLDRDRLVAEVAPRFPSFTLLDGEGVYEGLRRPVVMIRLRSDTSDAVVALAQHLCVSFAQRFVGIEAGGRYLRIYADDTA